MLTLEGIRAKRRLSDNVTKHRDGLRELASNPMFSAEAVKKEIGGRGRAFRGRFVGEYEAACRALKGVKLTAENALKVRQVDDALAERPGDTLAERQLKASKRLERELVKARVREELQVAARRDAAGVVRLYREALKCLKGRAPLVEDVARVEAMEYWSPALLAGVVEDGPQDRRSGARAALAEFEAVRVEDISRLRPESVRQLEAVTRDFRNLNAWFRAELAALGELTSANEIAGKAALYFEARAEADETFSLTSFRWTDAEQTEEVCGEENAE